MTEGPGQQPPQEPRNSSAEGEREVLEGRVIPSRNQSERGADPRRQFRQQAAAPDPQAPEPGPAWSAQADAAAQAAPQPTAAPPGEPWSATPPQPTLDAAPPAHEPTQIAPAQEQYAPPQAQIPPQAYDPQAQIPPQAYDPQAQDQEQQYAAPQQPYIPPQQAGQQPHGGYGYPHPQSQPPAPAPQQAAQQPQGGYGYPQAQQQPPQQPQGGYGYPQPQAQQPQAPAAPQQGGYGYPQAQPQQPDAQQPQPQAPAAPQQGGYGYPQAHPQQPQPEEPAAPQGPHVPFAGGAAPRPAPARERKTDPGGAGGFDGGPAGAASAESGTPDWNALAEESATGRHRRRVLMVTGGILAVAVIAGGVATAVVMSGKDSKTDANPTASTSTTASQQPLPPAPTFSSVAPPPPANPLDYLNTAAKDKAPLTPASLFPGKQFVWKGRTYVKTNSDVTTSCAKNARQQVASALSANGCQKLIRATFTSGGVAVTVGVAVFADDKHALKLQHVSQYLAPLGGGGVPAFCHAVRCQMTSNAVGRYAYFAIAGYKNGKTLAANDTEGRLAANDASDFAFTRIVQRGKDAAASDPARQ